MSADNHSETPHLSDARPSLRILAASCQYPAGLLDATPRSRALGASVDSLSHLGPADRSAELLHQTLSAMKQERNPPPTWTVLMGDQVYVDETAGMFDPAVLGQEGAWRATYGRRQRNVVWQRLRSSLNAHCFPMPDDHELMDNWARPASDDQSTWARAARHQLAQGLAMYWEQQRSMWPGPYNQGPTTARAPQDARPAGGDPPLWVDLSLSNHPLPIFLADTRTERQARTLASLQHDHIMDAAQRGAIERWLDNLAGHRGLRFLVSASAVLPRPITVKREPATALHHDAWCGYPASQAWLLQQIYERRADNLVLLSGDEHLSSVGTLMLHRPGGHRVRVALVHSSALYAPYPFANAQPRDFCVPDAFTLPHSGVQVTLEEIQFVPGDGFAIMQCAAEAPCGDDATLRVRFVRHHSETLAPIHIDLSLKREGWTTD